MSRGRSRRGTRGSGRHRATQAAATDGNGPRSSGLDLALMTGRAEQGVHDRQGVVRAADLERNPTGIDGDREVEELAAILLGGGETNQFVEGGRLVERRSQATVDGLVVRRERARPTSHRGGPPSIVNRACRRSTESCRRRTAWRSSPLRRIAGAGQRGAVRRHIRSCRRRLLLDGAVRVRRQPVGAPPSASSTRRCATGRWQACRRRGPATDLVRGRSVRLPTRSSVRRSIRGCTPVAWHGR